MTNAEIAQQLEETADLLQAQRANPFRLQSYRRAAATIHGLRQPLEQIYRAGGDEALRSLPGIGDRLAGVLRSLVLTGRLPVLERLRGEMDPVALLESVPGIGHVLAERMHHDLDIDTLEDLEIAAHQGRLGEIGVGPKKLAGIIELLATRLGRRRSTIPVHEPPPPLAELLDVDREYREKADLGELPVISPRRFNPDHTAWLPILHTQRGERHYTALYSNTARAHQMRRIRDWVVLYYDHGADAEQQCTVITAQRGLCAGERVIPGRERECLAYYRVHNRASREAAVSTGISSHESGPVLAHV